MVEVLDALDGPALRRWGHASIDGLVARCEEINSLNVFPVPDSDTGTNLLFTMRAAVDSVARNAGERADAHEVASAMARGATTGARGNSGIILSQVIRGLANNSTDGPLTARALCEALDTSSELVRQAISVPVEGTIVTVLDHAAAAARTCPPDACLAEIATAAASAGADALSKTVDQLPVLRDAGVVDAGGLGLVVLLDALVLVVTGSAPERRHFRVDADATQARPVEHVDPVEAPEYEVMYQLSECDDAAVDRLRERLGELGDSVVVVGDRNGGWSTHVHCDDAGAAVEAGLETGRVSGIRIGSIALEERAVRSSVIADRAVLTVVAGDGAAELFESEGARVLRCDEPISATGLLSAIRELAHREVLVLPNGALSAQELLAVGVAARDDRRDVLLLPTSSMVQGLAALAVHDAQRIAVDDAFAMSEAASSTRWGSLRVADERALTLVGTCDAGDGLGLIGHEVVVIESDVHKAGTQLLDRVLGLGGEMLTFLLGRDVPEALVDALTAHVADQHPGVEVLVYRGGQDTDLLQLGVE